MDKACANKALSLCTLDTNLLTLLEHAAVRDNDKINHRRQRVWDCLVDHADDLSPPCVAALVGNVATTQSVLPASGDDAVAAEGAANASDAAPVLTETTTHHDKEDASPISTPTPVPIMAHPTVVVSRPDEQPQLIQATGNQESGVEVRIFLINHPGAGAAAAPATPYLRIGGDTNQYSDGNHPDPVAASGMAMPAWLWVTLLPFLCIGLYVSATQAMAFIRRRRDVVYRVGAAQYSPIPSRLGGK